MLAVEFVVLLGVLISPLASAQTSGFYFDNGHQHVRERLLSAEERAKMQHKILNILGLPKAPHGAEVVSNHSLHHPHTIDKKAAAPKFLMDVYRMLLDEEQHLNHKKTEFEMTDTDIHAMHESDVIMSFTSQVPPTVALRHQRDQRLWFNVSQVPSGESIVASELRVNKRKIPLKNNKLEKFTITLSQLVRQEDGEALKKISEVPFDSSSEGWILFNVTQALYDWVHNEKSNLGLIMTVTRLRTGKTVKAEEAGVVTAQLKNSEKQPFMVAFFKSEFDLTESAVTLQIRDDLPLKVADETENEIEESTGPRRAKRDTKKKKKSPEQSSAGSFKHLVSDLSPTLRSEKSCQLRTMFVSFADLGWQDWIIAPDGYAAYYCSGDCFFPLTSHMNATNHAIVQTLVHLLKPTLVPTPCCAPTKLAGISVLYYMDTSANVILKPYKNMVVKACGCQ
ncbi:protein 60A [Neocloeon triangulifer]|uniref:protein 60A n=1 Tax=Neocloeon triangulifer TaxID=2078957 RepID=UPI00286F312B|nr:protein 60A [Neocloeon triangulifer]XP_059482439.1 protein 60A [Neocloeon triangulifer]